MVWRWSPIDGIGYVTVVAIVVTVRNRHNSNWNKSFLDESVRTGLLSIEKREKFSVLRWWLHNEKKSR